jgi:hypothetical protein
MPDRSPEHDPLASQPGGRDEMNLAEFPISLLTDRVRNGQKTIEFEDPFYDEPTGRVITRKLVITASDKYGLPTPKDDEVIVGLLQLTKEANNFTDRTVAFSRSELIERLQWPDTGQSFRRIAESFDRWTSVYLNYEKAWWDHEHRSWVDEKFHIIDRVSLYDRDRQIKQGSLKLSSFTWSDVLFRSFQSGYLKRIDFDFYISLDHPTAKRMYRFLDKRFYLKRRWDFDLKEFAWDHIGLSRGYTDSGKIKEKLQPALDELEQRGFLEPMTREERYAKLARGEWRISLAQKAARVLAEKARTSEPSDTERALIERGVTPATATELIAGRSAEQIQAKLDVFDWLMEKRDKRIQKSPAGYLVESIRNDYAAPKGFESKADREKKQAAEKERQRKAEEAKRRADATEKAREEAEQARIKAYLDSLSPAEQEELQAAAMAAANPFFLRQYRQSREPELSARYLKLIVETHVSGILARGGQRGGSLEPVDKCPTDTAE